MQFPIEFTPDENGTLLVTFPDIPEAITFGTDEADALSMAVEALETAFIAMMSDREDIPEPSPAKGRPTVSPTLLGELKVAVYRAMRARGWRKADLARSLDVRPRQIDRLLDLRHASTVAQLEAALATCGRRAEVETREYCQRNGSRRFFTVDDPDYEYEE
jgi:antitoxin HicB